MFHDGNLLLFRYGTYSLHIFYEMMCAFRRGRPSYIFLGARKQKIYLSLTRVWVSNCTLNGHRGSWVMVVGCVECFASPQASVGSVLRQARGLPACSSQEAGERPVSYHFVIHSWTLHGSPAKVRSCRCPPPVAIGLQYPIHRLR
ncbi:MAG TPA: hypothetical protein DIV36_05035, partial [Verrucomicrobiales bacterium]|nr:hypothetical protein [Verrucomicrobiales bacterium]